MWPRALSEAGAGSAGLEEPSPSLAVAPLPPGPRDMRSDAGARGAGPRGRSSGVGTAGCRAWCWVPGSCRGLRFLLPHVGGSCGAMVGP